MPLLTQASDASPPAQNSRIRLDEVIARANNLLIGRAAYETAVRLYPRDVIQYRDGARIIERSDRESGGSDLSEGVR